MEHKKFPSPETQINVLKRYLHVLALLQNNKDSIDWNASTLADMLSIDNEDDPISDKTIRDYISKNIIGELGIDIAKNKGGRRTGMSRPLDKKLLRKIANIYASFVVSDTGRDIVLKHFINKHPYDCLWLMARIHFAIIDQWIITFDYTTNDNRSLHYMAFHPYHMVFKNNNLYLIGKDPNRDHNQLLIASRIENLKVTDTRFRGGIPEIKELFQDTLGSFIGKKYKVKLKFDASLLQVIEQVLSILEPSFVQSADKKTYEAAFTISDDRYLCKQLLLYGNRVEIIEPKPLREMMIAMLKESLSVYE